MKPMNSDWRHLLDMAVHHMQAGRLDEAGHCCLEILAVDDNHPRALHILGLVAHKKGRHDDAVFLIGRAVALDEGVPEAHNNLGNALKALGRFAEAEASYTKALGLRPGYGNAHNNMGAALLGQGRFQEALDHFRLALEQLGPLPEVLNNLGNALHELGQMDEAIVHYQHALRLQPGFPQVLNNLGRAFIGQGRVDEGLEKLAEAINRKPDYVDAIVNMGRGLSDSGQKDEAVLMFRRALDIEPDHLVALHSLGSVFQELGRLDESVTGYRQVLELNPDHYEAQTNLGVALLDQGAVAEAEAMFTRAVGIAPHYALAWNNLGVVHLGENRMDEAVECFNRAYSLKSGYYEALNNVGVALYKKGELENAIEKFLEVQKMSPDYPDAYYNEGMAQLALGNYARGWLQSEWRLRMKAYRIEGHDEPLLDKSKARGKRVLLHCEQGLGDGIQFIRYASMVKALGTTVVVFCPQALERLLTSVVGVDFLSSDTTVLPVCDHRLPVLSLPLMFQTDLSNIPVSIPYVSPDPGRTQAMAAKVQGAKGLKVGLVWRGNPGHSNDRNRSLSVDLMTRLLEVEGCTFFNLQLGLFSHEREVFSRGANWLDASGEFSDLADTAAFVVHLDLVIAVDTSVAHLAGALGRPVWVLLPYVADWRWLQVRLDSPWYPTMRLFRQPALGDWDAVMTEVKQKLFEVARGVLSPVWSLPD